MKKNLFSILLTVSLIASSSILLVPAAAQAATTITTCAGLAGMSSSGDYVLGSNIDCSGVPSFTPIVNFTGKLDGAGHTIQHFTITGFTNGHALFGTLNGAKIYNLSFTNANVETNFVGGVLATVATNETKIVNVHVQGAIQSGAAISVTGGLIGSLDHSYMYYSSSNIDVTGFQTLGGLVGQAVSGSVIEKSFSAGTVFSNNFSGNDNVGGLAGIVDNSLIANSYSQSDVTTGNTEGAGFIGLAQNIVTILNSYSTGAVTGPGIISGFIALADSDTDGENNYWDVTTSGQISSPFAEGKTTAEMQSQSTFANWNFTRVWDIDPGDYPTLIPYDTNPAVLTEIAQIPTTIRRSQAPKYIFDFTSTSDQTVIMTPCGGISDPQVGFNSDGHEEVHIIQTEIGQTYTCEVYTVTLTDLESNHLTIGPFTVVPNPATSGSVATKDLPGAGIPIPNQQTPALSLDQQLTTPTLGVNSLLTRNLYFGLRGSDVKALQQYLNSHGFPLAKSGPGSPGNETEVFGVLTRAAVIRYQKAKGISPAVGYVGPITRASIQQQ